jgi:hypothetical protein
MAVVVWALLPKPLFIIDIREQNIFIKKGKVPAGFIQDCEGTIAAEEIPDLKIKGFATQDGVSLKFSRSTPAQYH